MVSEHFQKEKDLQRHLFSGSSNTTHLHAVSYQKRSHSDLFSNVVFLNSS